MAVTSRGECKNACKKGVRYRENREKIWVEVQHKTIETIIYIYYIYIYMMRLEYTNRKKRKEKHIYLKGSNDTME